MDTTVLLIILIGVAVAQLVALTTIVGLLRLLVRAQQRADQIGSLKYAIQQRAARTSAVPA